MAASAPELCPTITVFSLQLRFSFMNGIQISSRDNTAKIHQIKFVMLFFLCVHLQNSLSTDLMQL